MSKTIRDYIPLSRKRKTIPIQGRVDADVVIKARKIMKAEGITWGKLIEAAARQLSDDRKGQ